MTNTDQIAGQSRSDYQAALAKAQPIGNTDELDRLFERMIAEAAAYDKKALDAAP